MSRRARVAALLGVVVLQAAVLVGLWAYSQYPLWTGQAVTLVVRPVDPRDPFRGPYLRLDYDIGTLPIPENGVPRAGRDVYVRLKRHGGVWRAGEVRFTAPDKGVYLNGRISAVTFDTIRVRYGIEAWFADPERVRSMGMALREGGVASIKVAPDGRAALIAVRPREPAG